MTVEHPSIANSPGLQWRARKAGWEARWYARTDIVQRGYLPRSMRLWVGPWPSDEESVIIAEKCQTLQTDMLNWSNGALRLAGPYDGTLGSLIDCYQTDPDSDYQKIRHSTRINYNSVLRALRRGRWVDPSGVDIALEMAELKDIKARVITRWYEQWSAGGKVGMAHSIVTMMRVLLGFGLKFLECPECERLAVVMHKMKFPHAQPGEEFLSAEQVIAIRRAAHEGGRPSIALAQAIQFECTLRQKDVIGEWVPTTERSEMTEVLLGNSKWIRGVRWDEIDANMILRHITSKKLKPVVVDLKLAPMVLEEFAIQFPNGIPTTHDPIVVNESTRRPWSSPEFRYRWRKIARSVGVPDEVCNCHTRAGAITEASEAGAPLEHIKHAATHSNIGTTEGYSRNAEKKTASVMQIRVASRKHQENG